jgi:hypothetical protein
VSAEETIKFKDNFQKNIKAFRSTGSADDAQLQALNTRTNDIFYVPEMRHIKQIHDQAPLATVTLMQANGEPIPEMGFYAGLLLATHTLRAVLEKFPDEFIEKTGPFSHELFNTTQLRQYESGSMIETKPFAGRTLSSAEVGFEYHQLTRALGAKTGEFGKDFGYDMGEEKEQTNGTYEKTVFPHDDVFIDYPKLIKYLNNNDAKDVAGKIEELQKNSIRPIYDEMAQTMLKVALNRLPCDRASSAPSPTTPTSSATTSSLLAAVLLLV